MGTAILIIVAIILLIVIYKYFKPYFIKYDTTLLFTGGLGSGKSLESVKTSVVLIRKQRFYKYYVPNWWERRIRRPWIRMINFLKAKNKKEYHAKVKNLKIAWEYNQFLHDHNYRYFFDAKKKRLKKYCLMKKYKAKPMLYSNIPIHYKTHFWSKKREWAKIITPRHVYLLKKIREYSVVMIDEFPQFINQFMWDEELVQDNCNEFITFYRHYVGGFLILNAQSESDIVVQFRRKLNQAIWCFNFKKHLFGLFYTNKMADIMLSDNVSTIAQTQIEENAKTHFGLFPPKKTYDTRCYSIRYKEILQNSQDEQEHTKLKTNRILRSKYYLSPLDKTTTKKQKESMLHKAQALERD